jgi:aromatic-L-amino-acid decarboxylase
MGRNLSLGINRQVFLEEVTSHILAVWNSFDQARADEPQIGEEVTQWLSQDIPESGISPITAYKNAAEILDQSTAQSRPRFLAFVGSSGLEVGTVADLLASTYDVNLATHSGAASHLENQTSKWLAQFVGFSNSRGLFTSGGTVSNITALAAARQRVLPESRITGNSVPLAVYCSQEAHYSNKRAIELLGLGSQSLRFVPIDEQHRMNPAELLKLIERDLSEGVTPMAIIATAGTTLTGAVDPLRDISEIAQKFNIWMHVDGAYGAPAAGVETSRDLFDGLDLADSLTIDAHKWLFVPKACSILLVKDYSSLASTFGHEEAYMPHEGYEPNPVDVTLEYSRPLRALKLWLGFLTHGAAEFRSAIEENIALANLLYDRADGDHRFRVLPNRPQLSIVPLQYRPLGIDDPKLISDVNSRLCDAIVEDGRFFLSPAVIDNEIWLRPCFTNFRTEPSDVDAFFDVIGQLESKI